MELATVLAILLAPIIAVLLTVYLQYRKEKRQNALWIFSTLMGTRHSPITDETFGR